MADNNKFLWFVTGAALGASVALLYAPQSGRETRRIIKRKTREGREVLAESGRDIVDTGRDLYKKGRRVADEAAELFERGRRLVEG
jgi:gas vesicle protein